MWNTALAVTGLVFHLTRNILAEPSLWLWTGGVLAAFAAALIALIQKQNRELRFLREGVAVHGIIRSGEVIEFGDSVLYKIRYSYWTGDEKPETRRRPYFIVDAAEYDIRTSGANPYFTVLYDAANPSDSVPYSRISCAELVAR